jgi:TonB dependent receptor-like, beta-barrel/Carboxypeptidase regulatory-like domain
MRLLRTLSLLLVAALAVGAAAHAGETGSISGVVKDAQGGVLPGVTVKVSGPLLPAGREAVATAAGNYFFPNLLPGVYKVEAGMSGMGKVARELRVYLDVDAQVELVLSPTATEEVTVVAQAEAVDLKKTEVNFNYTADATQNLPLGRSYSGLFQLIPGVAQNNSSIGPAAGGSRQDNTYLMDGVNITNPGFGYLETEVNELDIAEFNVKRGAISAEFGRAAGIVTNAVSRSGTNTFSGSARVVYQPLSFMSKPEDPAFGVVRTDNINPAVGLGGPIVKDKVFFYASAQYFRTNQPDRVNKFGTALPDRLATGQEYYGKITSTPTPKHLLAASYRYRPSDTEGGFLSASSSSADPSVTATDKARTQIATAAWSFFATSRTTIDVKYLYMKDKTSSDPVTSLSYLPTWDNNNLAAMGQYTDPTRNNMVVGGSEYTNRQNYRRNEIKGSVSQYFDLGKTTHQLKAGVGYTFGEEDLNRLTNGWGTISRITATVPYYRARYYFQQPSQIGQGRTWSIFAQDTMTVASRLTLNLGVLLNQDSYAQDLPGSGGCPVPANTTTGKGSGAAVFETDGDRCTFVKFKFGDEIQPRLGLNFNVRPGKGDKAYVNWGRYYNMDQQSSSRSLAPRRIYQREARFAVATGALISDLPRASTTGKLIDPDLKPTYNDEWLAGYATPMGSTWGLDVFYIYRNTKNFIEDLPSIYPSGSPYAAANLPCTLFQVCQGAEAKRKYQAATVEVNRRFANKWSANVSYTWSKFEGNFDLDYGGETAVFNTSSFIQDGPGTFVQDEFRYGPLRQDRPHVFKVFANYEPIARLMLGGYLRVQSGTPWNARGQDSQGGSALYYLEQAGSHRNPTWTNFDLLASYRFRLGAKASLVVEARALNLFDSQTQLSTDSVKYTDFKSLSVEPFIAPGTILNSFFGTANGFAAGRRVVLAARLDF